MKARALRIAADMFSSLGVPNYRLFFAGQTVSLIGTWMQMTAQAWLVLTLTRSSTDLGLVVAIQTIPVLLLGPYAGVIADRVDKRLLSVVLQAAMGVQALVLGLLSALGAVTFFDVCLLAVVLGLNNAFEMPARQAFVREMVGRSHLRNAVSLNSVTNNAARTIGPAVAGLLIATVGDAVCFFLNAASFVAVIASLLKMDLASLRPSEPEQRARGQLREGLAYAARTTEIAAPLVMMALVGMLAYEFQVSLPVFAHSTFHGGSEAYGFMTGAMGIGAVIGGLATAARGRTGVRPMLVASGGFGLAILFTALAPALPIAYVGMVLIGWASVWFVSIGNSTIQLSAEPNLRGRVMSLWQVAFQGTTPFGGPIIGAVIAASDPRVGLLVGAASCFLAIAAGGLLARRKLASSGPRSDASLLPPAPLPQA